MISKTTRLFTGLCVLLFAVSAHAADVVHLGSTTDIAGVVDLTSAAVSGTVEGTLFWDYTNGPQDDRSVAAVTDLQRNNLPTYLTFGPGTDLEGVSGGWGYQQVLDDFGGPFETGTLAAVTGTNPNAELATFTVGAGAPSEFRLGVMTDNLDNAIFVGTNLTVDGGSSSASLDPSTTANTMSDVHWFDVTNVADGDLISIQTGASGNDFGAIAGFVVTVPEPATGIWVVGIALAGLAAFRRR